MGLVKARIYLLNKNFTRNNAGYIQVMFNPEKLKITNTEKIKMAGTKNNKTPQASRKRFMKDMPIESQQSESGTRTLEFELFYDTYSMDSSIGMKEEEKDVRAYTLKVTELLNQNKKCQFVWGTFIFSGILTSITENYDMFTQDGIPCRATLNINMKEVRTKRNQLAPDERKEIKKLLDVNVSDILTHIANEKTGNAKNWREIAREYGINNPRIN
ncbi:MAG: hypothetical protein N2645_06100 [Clostridia bacterium]|nr:hypothetical protein [Clostridia bacterium]